MRVTMMNMKAGALLALGLSTKLAAALALDVNSPDSIKAAASSAAYGLMKWYDGDVTNTIDTIGVLPKPYYWWEGGAMWGALVDYWRLTGDSTYNPKVTQALLSQVGPLYDYMMPNRQKETGNDDQAFWGFATMAAAEHGYPEPPSPIPSWLQLTENLWNTQAARWDTGSCGGGLKWQVFSFNNGYHYKNAVSNGAFFQLSARLARMTRNATYIEWANKAWGWSESIGLIDGNWYVYDGTDDLQNCASINHMQWSYSVGIYTYGASIMYNITTPKYASQSSTSLAWQARTQSLVDASKAIFFSPYSNATDVMYEQACETIETCNYDQRSFKAYLARFFWATTQLAPFTAPAITPVLTASALAAGQSCSGQNAVGTGGATYSNACGAKWYTGGYDGNPGPGQQLSALEVIQGLLTSSAAPPKQAGFMVGILKRSVDTTARRRRAVAA